jgi:hypothetical protein
MWVGLPLEKSCPVMASTSGEVTRVMEFTTDKKAALLGVIPFSG